MIFDRATLLFLFVLFSIPSLGYLAFPALAASIHPHVGAIDAGAYWHAKLLATVGFTFLAIAVSLGAYLELKRRSNSAPGRVGTAFVVPLATSAVALAVTTVGYRLSLARFPIAGAEHAEVMMLVTDLNIHFIPILSAFAVLLAALYRYWIAPGRR